MVFDDEEEVVGDSVVRSFMVTSGRTRSDKTSLNFETLVELNLSHTGPVLQFERLAICQYISTQQSTSIAEVAAELRLPMLTAQVLVSDLAAEGYLSAHETANSELNLSSLSDIRAAILSL